MNSNSGLTEHALQKLDSEEKAQFKKKKKSYFWMDIEHPNPSFHVLNLVGDGADGLY